MSTPLDASQRTCDQCRFRKIRCSRSVPCAQCTTSDQHCSFTGAGRRPKEVRHRVLVSTQYEEKIDRLEEGLSRVEEGLRQLNQAQHRKASTYEASSTSPGSEVPSSLSQQARCLVSKPDDAPKEHTFEGSSSMAAHVSLARICAEQAVERGSAQSSSPHLGDALRALHMLLQAHRPKDEDPFAHQKYLDGKGLAGLPMPPPNTVLSILRELKSNTPLTFTLICAFGNVENFADHCRKVYFATEDFTEANFVITNAGLYFIFAERMVLARHGSDLDIQTFYETQRNLCRDNLETVLAKLSLLLPARKENVIALVMGASYAIEISKPSLAWRLSTSACQLCLTLGYHRGSNLAGENEEVKAHRTVLFWLAYILDKALALRLGRPSILQDYEITLPRTLPPFKDFALHRDIIQTWMVHAEVQGQVYEKLFSPAALYQSADKRIEIAHRNAERLRQEVNRLLGKRTRLQSTSFRNMTASEEIEVMLLRSDELALVSTITLIYRAVTPTTDNPLAGESTSFTTDCITIAREAIWLHLECIDSVQATTGLAKTYLHWTILFSPFIPFIVLFCHVIESCSTEDLELIERFMNSLGPLRNLSGHADKLFQLCNVLNHLAQAYVQSRTATNQHRSQPLGWYPRAELMETDIAVQPENANTVTHHKPSTSGNRSSFEDPHMSAAGTSPLQYHDLFIDYMNIMETSDFSGTFPC